MPEPVAFAVRLAFALALAASAAGQPPVAVTTFESIGICWSVQVSSHMPCQVRYRATGTTTWRTGHPLWNDGAGQYRGSIVHLHPATTYDIQLTVGSQAVALAATTWSEDLPVGTRVRLPESSTEPLVIGPDKSGSPVGYTLFEPAPGGSAVIDVADLRPHCVSVDASHVILRGLTLRGASRHGIELLAGANDVVIEECDISGWGRVEDQGVFPDRDSAIYGDAPTIARVVVQRNRIHAPRGTTNTWLKGHPRGPQAVHLWDSGGNHVIRYNLVFGDENHYFNDVFGAGANCGPLGFPGADSDIYCNRLSHCRDDAIEAEGGNSNVRIWGNYIEDAFVAVAVAGTSKGPVYVWRNVAGTSLVAPPAPGIGRGYFLKAGNDPLCSGGRVYVFHNTMLQPSGPEYFELTAGGIHGVSSRDGLRGIVTRNNTFHLATASGLVFRTTPAVDCDFDFDLTSSTQWAMMLPLHEMNGILATQPVYEPEPWVSKSHGTITLAHGMPGHDDGVVVPGFNDDFLGGNPDRAAHETGSAPMEFGVDAYRGFRLWVVPNPAQPGQNVTLSATRGSSNDAVWVELIAQNGVAVPPTPFGPIGTFDVEGRWQHSEPVPPGSGSGSSFGVRGATRHAGVVSYFGPVTVRVQ